MSGGILALFGLCLGAAILEIALPGDDKNGPKQFLGFFTALVVLLLILHPIFRLPHAAEALLEEGNALLTDAEVTENYEQALKDAVSARSKTALEAGLYNLLETEFDLTPADCTVNVTLAQSGELARLEVRLRGSGLLQDPREVEARLRQLFVCETEVR